MNAFDRRLRQVALAGGYVLAFVVCVGGSLLSLALLGLPASRKRERWGRWIVHAVSRIHTWYMAACGVVGSDLRKLAPLRAVRGVIIAVNHPTMLDAIMMFSELPQTFCLVKGDVWRNPLLGLMARAAGFVSNEQPAGIIEECLRRLRQGETLIIFPEGTRSVDDPINELQPGFALLARRSGVPVQTVLIGSNRQFLGKRVPFFNLDLSFPIRYEFEMGERFNPASFRKARQMCATIDAYFRASLHR